MFSPVCYLDERDIMATAPLRVGYVPEHFSTPLYFAKKHFGLNAELIPFPSGTGHMITALRGAEIDVGIGLTEGWVAGLGKEDVVGNGGYALVGTYVETPLCEYLPTFLSPCNLHIQGLLADGFKVGLYPQALTGQTSPQLLISEVASSACLDLDLGAM
jgi:hypothetical protein